MLKKIILPTLFLSSIYAQNLNYAFLNKHSFTLAKGDFNIKSSYLKINNDVDIFNFKEKELGSSSSLSTIGNMDGYDLELRYGITNKDSLFINYQRENIDYQGSTLSNDKIEIFNRYNLVSSKYATFNSLSIDIGFISNSAGDVDIKDETILNSLLGKISPDSSFSISDGSVVDGDSTYSLYDSTGEKISPYVAIKDMDSKSYYVRLLMAKRFSSTNILDLYIGAKYTDLTTTMNVMPDNNTLLNKLTSTYSIPNFNRDEKVYTIGLATMTQMKNFIFEFNYEHNYIKRDDGLEIHNESNIIDTTLSYIIDKNFIVYLGIRAMFQQFNTDIPYMYNQYTKTQFDKNYGYAQTGLVYSFKGF